MITSKKSKRRLGKYVWSLILLLISILLINGVIFAYYHNRTYPNTFVAGKNIGNISFGELSQKAPGLGILPTSLELKHKDKKTSVTLPDLGISPDYTQLTAAARKHGGLPIVNLLIRHNLPVPINFDDAKLDSQTEKLKPFFKQDPVNARITLVNNKFDIAPAQPGYQLDGDNLKVTLIRTLTAGYKNLEVPTAPLEATIQPSKLEPELKNLRSQLGTPLSFTYKNTAKKPGPAEISKWFEPSGNSFALSDQAIRAYLVGVGDSFGIKPKNLSQMVADVKNALQSQKSYSVTLVPFDKTKSFSYCVALKGVDGSYLADFKNKLAATYSDARGWSLDGQVSLNQATSGCNFTVWLSAASQVPSFGSICDVQWSCMPANGNSVVINFDRWRYASDAWNASHGTLDDYRSMVINHETGHWFGFEHRHCGGPGQFAPVMQQQSINLEGCKFNPWPIQSELDSLKNILQL